MFEIVFRDGRRWVGSATHAGAALNCAVKEVYGEDVPRTFSLTIVAHDGGAVIDPPEKTDEA